jgi:bacterioferritin-associated ferredoxin
MLVEQRRLRPSLGPLSSAVMIICMCNRISDGAAREVACSGLCRSVADIYRCMGCRVQCGKCVPEMRRLFDEAQRVAREAEAKGSAPVSKLQDSCDEAA